MEQPQFHDFLALTLIKQSLDFLGEVDLVNMRVDANHFKNIWFLLYNSLIPFLPVSEHSKPPSHSRQSSANSSGLILNTGIVRVLISPMNSCLTLGKSLHFSVPRV